MREEVQRISKLVADGKLTPEDAAVLIDAFYQSDRQEESEAQESASTPPPPPGDGNSKKTTSARGGFQSIIESIEKMTKEGIDTVDWGEVSKQAKSSAKKGLDQLKSGLEDLSKGKVNIGWLVTHEEKVVTLPLSLAGGKKLRVENACGSVKIVGGFDAGSATAQARFKAATLEEARQKAEAYTLIIEESDHFVDIRQPDINGIHVDLEIQMPGHASVEARVESGDVQIVDTKGGVRVEGRSGNVVLRGLDGIVEVTTASGNISVEDSTGASISLENKSGNIRAVRVKGNMKARASSGDISITASSGKVMSVETASGNVTVDLEETITGTLNVRTVNGNVLATIPDGSDCRVSLSTLRGSVQSSLPLTDEARADSRITGRLGSGTGTLDISAVTGNITLEMRDHVSA